MNHTDYFATAAQVIPVLVLALAWEANYLERLKNGQGKDPKFWIKKRIRAWSRILLPYSVAAELVAFGVLADVIPSSPGIQLAVAAALLALATTLVVRLISDVNYYASD